MKEFLLEFDNFKETPTRIFVASDEHSSVAEMSARVEDMLCRKFSLVFTHSDGTTIIPYEFAKNFVINVSEIMTAEGEGE